MTEVFAVASGAGLAVTGAEKVSPRVLELLTIAAPVAFRDV